MKKLSLDLNALAVESLDTVADAPEQRGTVHGHGPTWPYNGCTAAQPCNPASSPDYTEDRTCDDATCFVTCGVSCGGTCYNTCGCPSQVNTCWETCQVTVPC